MLGHVNSITRNAVLGWAALPDEPAAAVELVVLVNGRAHGRCVADQQQDELRSLFPGATGRYGFQYNFEWPLSLFETHEVEVLTRQSRQPISNGKQTLPEIGGGWSHGSRAWSTSVRPILVTSTGRSGSSLCMARLGAHPQIVVGGDYPYEILLVSYYALALRTLASQEDRARSMRPDAMLGKDHRFGVGFNPYNQGAAARHPLLKEYWLNQVPARLAEAFAAIISEYYLAAQRIAQKSRVRLFAEKSQPQDLVRQAALMMFGTLSQIVLIRDPRDLLCSYKAFFKSAPEAAVASIHTQLQRLRQMRERDPPGTLFVRYEDLILQRDATMGLIWDFLEVEPLEPSQVIASEQVLFERHGTSTSPELSIGRWEHELGAAEIGLCEQKFGPILEFFGYER